MRRRAKTGATRKASKVQALRLKAQKLLRQLRQWLTRVYKWIRRVPLGVDVVTVLLLAWGVYQYRVALVPAVQPDAAISSSSLDLPITVRNPGDFFNFKDVQFFCDMTEQRFDSNGDSRKFFSYDYYKVEGLVEWPIRQPPLSIPPGDAVSFPCNIAANSHLNLNGRDPATGSLVFSEPMPMKLIRLSIKTQYSVDFRFFRWRRQAKSQTFTWQQVSGGWQWLPGDTLPGPN